MCKKTDKNMAGCRVRTLTLILIVVCVITAVVDGAPSLSENYSQIEKEIEALQAQEKKDSVPYDRQTPLTQSSVSTGFGPTSYGQLLTEYQAKILLSQKGGPPLASEAQTVWAQAKQALVDQLSEQIRDIEASVRDESAASNSVQRCLQSANAAELEARQQSKLVGMLTKNSNLLIENIDKVEKVANEDLSTTDDHLTKLKENLQSLRHRALLAQKELVEIHECGKIKPLKRLRRCKQRPGEREGRRTEPGQAAAYPVPVQRDQCVTRKWRTLNTVDEELAQVKTVLETAKKQEQKAAVAQSSNEAQAVWSDAQTTLLDQLYEQIKESEQGVLDGTAAVTSVQRCVQSASAAGLEARQQSKIVNLLIKNSKELVDHIESVELAAGEDVANTDERVRKYKINLESLRARITKAQEDLVAIQECGKIKKLNRLRRRKEALDRRSRLVKLGATIERVGELPADPLAWMSQEILVGERGQRDLAKAQRWQRDWRDPPSGQQDQASTAQQQPLLSVRRREQQLLLEQQLQGFSEEEQSRQQRSTQKQQDQGILEQQRSQEQQLLTEQQDQGFSAQQQRSERRESSAEVNAAPSACRRRSTHRSQEKHKIRE